MPRGPATTELAYDDNLARGLKRARLSAGVGLREAGRLTGIDVSTIYRIEKEQIEPTVDTLQRLCRVYGANLNVGPDGLMLTWNEEVASE